MTDQNNRTPLTLALSPAGHLYLDTRLNAQEFLPLAIAKKIQLLFKENSVAGLLHLGIRDFSLTLPPSFSFWQKFARRFVTEACKQHETSTYPNAITTLSLQERQEQARLFRQSQREKIRRQNRKRSLSAKERMLEDKKKKTIKKQNRKKLKDWE